MSAEKMKTIKAEYTNRRLCADHNGKWEPGRCLLCEIKRLQARLAEATWLIRIFADHTLPLPDGFFSRLRPFLAQEDKS